MTPQRDMDYHTTGGLVSEKKKRNTKSYKTLYKEAIAEQEQLFAKTVMLACITGVELIAIILLVLA